MLTEITVSCVRATNQSSVCSAVNGPGGNLGRACSRQAVTSSFCQLRHSEAIEQPCTPTTHVSSHSATAHLSWFGLSLGSLTLNKLPEKSDEAAVSDEQTGSECYEVAVTSC